MYQLILALGQYQFDDWIAKRLKRLKCYKQVNPEYAELIQIAPNETVDALRDRIHDSIMNTIMNIAKINTNKFYRHVTVTIPIILIDDSDLTVQIARTRHGERKFHMTTHIAPIWEYVDGFIYLVHAWQHALLGVRYDDAIRFGMEHCNGHEFYMYIIRTKHIGGPDFDFSQNRFYEERMYNTECHERIKNLTNPNDIRKIILEYTAYEFQRFNPDGSHNGGFRSNNVEVTQHTFNDPSFVADLKNTKYPIDMDTD